MKSRYIVHVDMDAFFAAVEQRDNKEYRGKPVIVGSDPKGGKGRGVVSTCSYEARKFGIHSAMPISIAYRKCPDGVFLPVDMDKYIEASHNVFSVLGDFTPDIQPISIDEAFMDITGSWHLFGTPLETCRKIKAAVKKKTRLTASLGMAPNMMTAKIASDLKKPDGLVIVPPEDLIKFLHPLHVGRLWGIGVKTEATLKEHGILTIGDLASRGEDKLERLFGKHGLHAWDLANGIDPRDVEVDDTISSVGNEHTFDTDTGNMKEVRDILMYLSEKVSSRLRKYGFKGRTITLKIRFSDFKTYTRAVTISGATNFTDVLYGNIMDRLKEFDISEKTVRLLGVKVSNLKDASWRDDMFSDEGADTQKNERIHKAIDQISNRYGEGTIRHRG
ncbi:MAG: DNA polymerase IV [Candidatus Tantalella remota]|nr:DNA polymerase IV [Candidatus Tantalella remota]